MWPTWLQFLAQSRYTPSTLDNQQLFEDWFAEFSRSCINRIWHVTQVLFLGLNP
jgi:hypothetical protein